ncbi:hypothetical protein ZIOFF_033288 [Zingiber officinale]|uniref:Retrotransposon Copia-like N-terminal domain-containing protein n=1 Tax=Zingiber officinale TaxID=94328 RepID=A0A8J5GQ21_ZINOF|nr:hypothetical protein ZIOFF_033288 [Zingiber officinale]
MYIRGQGKIGYITGNKKDHSIQITSIRLNGDNFLRWSQSVRMYIRGQGKIGYITGNKKDHSVQITSIRLNGDNFLQWSQSVRMYIRGQGKIGYITSDKAPGLNDSLHVRWNAKNSMVMTCLVNSMEENISTNYMCYPTAKETDSDPFNKEQMDQLLKLIKFNFSSRIPSVSLAQTGSNPKALHMSKALSCLNSSPWIIDSEATDHMSSCSHLFDTYSPCSGNEKIRIADELFKGFDCSSLHCETYLFAKLHRSTYLPKNYQASKPFYLIHSDIWGHLKLLLFLEKNVPSVGNSRSGGEILQIDRDLNSEFQVGSNGAWFNGRGLVQQGEVGSPPQVISGSPPRAINDSRHGLTWRWFNGEFGSHLEIWFILGRNLQPPSHVASPPSHARDYPDAIASSSTERTPTSSSTSIFFTTSHLTWLWDSTDHLPSISTPSTKVPTSSSLHNPLKGEALS